MLLPSVSETLASVSRHPALEAAISALRRGVAHEVAREHVAGLTDTAKALVAAQVAAELRRPVVVIVTSGARAETLNCIDAARVYFAGPLWSSSHRARVRKLWPHRCNSSTRRSRVRRPRRWPFFPPSMRCPGRKFPRTLKFSKHAR